MKMEEKKLNVSINDGNEFFAHELSINFNPTQFVFDFRCITPRTDVRSRDGAVLNIKHNVVLVEPWHAKEIQRVLNNVIEHYEKQFGKIDKPKAIKKFEKNQQQMPKTETTKTETPSYMG